MSQASLQDTVEVRTRAQERARAVAAAGGVSVRVLTEPAEHLAAERLSSEIWQGEPPMPSPIMRTLAATGGYVAGAYQGAELVGFAAGFVTAPDASGNAHLHSHIAGVTPSYRLRNVGWAMKLHQRAWALENGLETISWTFDPLIRRNAFFNLSKLGADAASYLPDFYGDLADGINHDQGSDRLLVTWQLCLDKVERAAAGDFGEADTAALAVSGEVALAVGSDGGPEEVRAGGRARVLVCAVPADIESLRLADAGLARAWRSAMRRPVSEALNDGRDIAGFTRAGNYLLVAKKGTP